MTLNPDVNMLFATFVMTYWLLYLVCISEVLQAHFLYNCNFLQDRIYQLLDS